MSDFHADDVQHVEFEAPLSADSNQASVEKGRFSIDLALELEHQLTAMESPPVSPGRDDPKIHKKRESLDPEVIAHIIGQLRKSLADVTKERDDMVSMLASANSQEASLKDALQLMTDKATEAEENLAEARKKMKEDEEQIVMLRAKVEESRRGLMRLQTESRRQSGVPQEASRMNLASLGSTPIASKRASFTPMTGRPNGHRRISSVSDSNVAIIPSGDLSTSPNAQVLSFPDHLSSNPPPVSSRRFSGLFGRQSPPQPDVPQHDPNAVELEALRKELKTIKDELNMSKHELLEAHEAKEASEECVKTLREFIAENNIGVSDATGAGALPSPAFVPAMQKDDPKKTATPGWGFNLFKLDPAPKTATGASSAAPSTSIPTPAPIPVPTTATALSQKFGGFFGSRSNTSSSTLPSLQTNTNRDSTNSISDASSVTEPISPSDDIHGLGMAVSQQKDMNALSELGVTSERGAGVQMGR